ncbi:hypothetical protein HNR31_001593 [Anoxybacillus caldiproteolyticus]|uniref:Uncharacterized protein n=1 Tax=Thermaerobacillus caldiproteolyticus TaxID=247480 RepID=A0A7V9Z689_9BACL|nr:hypothetical protein [Anoxybacillus caldiproteolyticus]
MIRESNFAGTAAAAMAIVTQELARILFQHNWGGV